VIDNHATLPNGTDVTSVTAAIARGSMTWKA
jgi:hypothetical protein